MELVVFGALVIIVALVVYWRRTRGGRGGPGGPGNRDIGDSDRGGWVGGNANSGGGDMYGGGGGA